MFRDKQLIVDVEVDKSGHTRPLYESQRRSPPFFQRALLTLSLAVGAKEVVNNARPIHLESEQQAHALIVSGDTHRGIATARAFHDSAPRNPRSFTREHFATRQLPLSREQKAQQAQDLAKFIDTSGALTYATIFGFKNRKWVAPALVALSTLLGACGAQGGQVIIASETAPAIATETPIQTPVPKEIFTELQKEYSVLGEEKLVKALGSWMDKDFPYPKWNGHIYQQPLEVKTWDGKSIGNVYSAWINNQENSSIFNNHMFMIQSGVDGTAKALMVKLNNQNPESKTTIATGTLEDVNGNKYGTIDILATGPYYVIHPEAHDGVDLYVYGDNSIPRPTVSNGGILFSPVESILVTATPTAESIATPTAVENSAATIAQSLKYTTEELGAFPGGVKEKLVTVSDGTQKGIVGIGADGSERVLALEIENEEGVGVMTRVGEYKFGEHSIMIYANPAFDPLMRLLATEDTARLTFNFMTEKLALGQFKGETGGDANVLRTMIFDNNHNGEITPDLPEADPLKGDWPVKFVPSSVPAKFEEPIEVITAFGKTGWDAFKAKYPLLVSKIMDYRGVDDGNKVSGGLINVATDGHIQIILIKEAAGAGQYMYYIPKNLQEIEDIEKGLNVSVGWELFGILNTLSKWGDQDAFKSENNYPQYDRITRGLWEFSIQLK